MPLLDKFETSKKKPPVCPYCESTIEGTYHIPCPDKNYRYVYCEECNALLAIVPVVK